MPTPAFPERGRGKQTVDELLGRLRVAVVHERLDLGRRRDESPEGQVKTFGEDVAGSFGGKRQAFGFQFREDEGIERGADAIGVANFRDRGRHDRLEGPVPTRVRNRGAGFGRPRETLLHPFRQGGDLRRRDFLTLTRHRLDVLLLHMVDREDEAAGRRVAGDHHRTDFAALEDEVPRVEAQAGLLLFGAVAGVAMLGEDRPDFLFEKFDLGGGGRRRVRGQPG